MYCMGPTVQSVCPIPWDYTGLHRNVPMCTVWGLLSRVSVPSHGTTQDSIGMYQCVLYGPTVQSVCPIPLYHGTTQDSIGLYLCVLYGAHCPECLSHPAVPWDYTGPHRNVPMCTVWGPLHVQSVCPIPLYRGTTRDFIGLYLCVLYGANCPECLSHPVVPWDYTGLHRTVPMCTVWGPLSRVSVPSRCTVGLHRTQ